MRASNLRAVRIRRKKRLSLNNTAVFVTLCLLAILMGSPLVWMLSSSLKTELGVLTLPPNLIPDPFRFENYPEALKQMRFAHFFWNTLILTFGGVAGVLFSSALVGYGFARLRFPGRTPLFILLISTMLLPPQVTMIPQFILFKYLGWINTFLPIIVPAFLGTSAFSIFLMRQFFLTLPSEYEDAGRIDGANTLQIFWFIMLPIARPGLVTVGILSFMFYWNDFLQPLIYLSSVERWPLSLGLSLFQDRFASPKWNLVMAASLATITPCILLFFFAQKYIMTGLDIGGGKS